jgi:plastocyanin
MGKPGKIAFPVILVLGAITGYITYTSFAAVIPDENIDSPYYQPLSPGSSGNVPGDTGGAAAQQQQRGGAASTGAGTTTITILQGSAVQGSPDYDPDTAQVPVDNKVVWHNEDTVPHTATSGNGPQDPQSGQLFDTSIINGGEESTPVELQGVSEGQKIPYHCMVHPYMVGEITITAAAGGGQSDVGGGSAQTQGGATNQTGGANATNQTGGANATTTTGGAPMSNATTTGTTGNATETGTTGGEGGATGVSIVPGSSSLTTDAYSPNPIQVGVGDTITWTNDDAQPHTATSGQNATPDGRFDSGIMAPQGTFEHTFTEAGEFPYFCLLHPNMVGTVSVS